jgi:hypothetical protein
LSGAADLLAGWRAWRAARSVATVATTGEAVATAPNPQETAIVASVATVSGRGMAQCREARTRAYLAFAAEAYQALSEREPDPIEAAERAAVFGSVPD